MATKRLEVLITGNAKDAQKAFGDLEKSATRSGKGTTKALGGIKSGLIGLGVGAAALGSFKAFEESEKISRQTAAVIKSTGNEANVTADHIGDLAGEISKLGGVDDELVQSGENMLLTFTKVRNEAGKGNDIFDQATRAANDYAAATGTDVVNANKMLGKALNDPIKGMSALTRAGVSFTQQQKDQIATLVQSGDTLGAQKIILSEFEKQYGGSLEANATASGKAQVAMENLGESAGAILAPGLELLAGAASTGAEALSALPEGAQQAIVGIGGIATAAVIAGPKIASMASTVGDGAAAIKKFAETSPMAAKASQSIGSAVGAIGGLPAVSALGATGLGILAAGFIDAQISAERAKADIGDLQDMIESGLTPGEAAAKKLTNTLAGVDGGFSDLAGSSREFREGMDELGLSATDVAKFMTMSTEEWKKLRKQMLENPIGDSSEDIFNFVDNLDLMRGRTAEAAAQDKRLTDTQKELVAAGLLPATEATDANTVATEDNTAKTIEAKVAGDGWLGSNKDLIKSFQDRVKEQDKINDGLQESIDLAYASVDANLALKSAHDSVQDAQLALAEARKSGNPEEVQRAEDALTSAILRESQASVEAARTSAEAQGKTLSAADAASIQQAKLAELAQQTGFTSDQIKWLAAQLDNAARERQIKLDTAQASADIDALVRKMMDAGLIGSGGVIGVGGDIVTAGVSGALGKLGPPRAQGGGVFAGGFNLVGEQGPEIVQWGASGTVIPAAKTKQMLAGTSVNAGTHSMSGGGVTNVFHITETKDAEATARAVAKVFERQSRMGGSPLAGVR